MSLQDTFWRNVQRFMARDGIATPTDLARVSGIPQATLSRFSTGAHKSLSFAHIERLARTFRTDPARLFSTEMDHLPDMKIQTVTAVMERMSESQKAFLVTASEAFFQTAAAERLAPIHTHGEQPARISAAPGAPPAADPGPPHPTPARS